MKSIRNVDVNNKKVLLRCDFNVPLDDNLNILDDSRIVKSLDTIDYLVQNGASIIILSHMGRVNVREDKIKNTLAPVAKKLSELLKRDVQFIDNPVGMDVLNKCKNILPGQIIMLENTRYCDFPEKLESNNDENLAQYWASLGDIFVIDAFATMHRLNASVAGIAKFLPCYSGFLVEEELKSLNPVIENISHPFAVFMGGAKVDDKLKYVKNILKKCDYLLLGGGIANSFLLAMGYDVQDSLATNDEITLSEIKQLVNDYKDKIIFPVDFVFESNQILDLNTKSINKYIEYLKQSKTIFINGTCGKFEEERYAKGTLDLFKELAKFDAIKVAGGGDTLNFIDKYKLQNAFTYLSSGGGATLEYISSGHLKVLDYIENIQDSTKE